MEEDLRTFLASTRLDRYQKLLFDNGFESLDDLLLIGAFKLINFVVSAKWTMSRRNGWVSGVWHHGAIFGQNLTKW